jgi:uncharacterized protein YkwD
MPNTEILGPNGLAGPGARTAKWFCAIVALGLVLGLRAPSLAAQGDGFVRASYAPPAPVQRQPESRDPATATRYAGRLVDAINEYRAANNLPKLQPAIQLDTIALQHSARMSESRRISHDGFAQRFESTDSSMCVENVGSRFPHAEALLDGWRASPEHHRNLLEPRVRRIGVANVNGFVTYFACA